MNPSNETNVGFPPSSIDIEAQVRSRKHRTFIDLVCKPKIVWEPERIEATRSEITPEGLIVSIGGEKLALQVLREALQAGTDFRGPSLVNVQENINNGAYHADLIVDSKMIYLDGKRYFSFSRAEGEKLLEVFSDFENQFLNGF
jgi:hypothetical protein